MSWPGFDEQHQRGILVSYQGNPHYGNPHPEYPAYYGHEEMEGRGYGHGRRKYYSGDKEVIEGESGRMYGDKKEEDPLHYQPAGEKEGLPSEGLGGMLRKKEKADAEETVEDTKKKGFDAFLNESHAAMSSKYASSIVSDDVRRLRAAPVVLSASCVDEEIPLTSGVIVVNENKFARVQTSKFARDEEAQKKFHVAAVTYLRGLTALDFSLLTNANVEKRVSSFMILSDDKEKTPLVKMSPYVMWDKSTSSDAPSLLVDNARGFASLEKNDEIIESGYMINVVDPEGVRVYGNFGGKKGKLMKPGEALYFGEAMVYPGRAYRKPVWIRLASVKPSVITSKKVSVTEMDARMIPLKTGAVATEMKEYKGTAKRTLQIDTDTKSSSRRINASLHIDFQESL